MKKKILLSMLFGAHLYANNVVVDEDTGMMWQDSKTIVKKNYNNAIRYCKNLSLGGYSDWRLPNIDELMSISDKNRYKPAIKKIFKNTKSDWYWSSSKAKGYSSRAWVVDFSNGYDYGSDVSLASYVRCVRGGSR
jgi:hypothetical protein